MLISSVRLYYKSLFTYLCSVPERQSTSLNSNISQFHISAFQILLQTEAKILLVQI